MNKIITDGKGATKFQNTKGLGTNANPFIVVTDAPVDRIGLYQFADTIGDGSGAINMNVDGSSEIKEFMVTCPEGMNYGIARVIVALRDSGSMDSGGWGSNGGTPLANGIVLLLRIGGVDYPLTNYPIKSHYDLASVSHDIIHNSWGQGDEFITTRFTFTKAGQYLKLQAGDSLVVQIRDSLTFLVDQKLSVQGYKEII